MPETILVTAAEFSKAEKVFRSFEEVEAIAVGQEESELAKAVTVYNARAVIVGVETYRGPLYEALGNLGAENQAIIARFGVGHDSIDKNLARQHGIVVTNTPGALDQSVAEHTIWLLGSVARSIPLAVANMKAGNFSGEAGFEVGGKTLGIIGLGNIGRRVAQIAHFGLGMKVLGTGRRSVEAFTRQEGKTLNALKQEIGLEHYTTDIDMVLAESDIISIHLPCLSETRHFFDTDRLARCKQGSILINTARGPIVDESALFDALASGHLAGAGLDVFETEPYLPISADKDLRQLKNVVLTPHIGSNTKQANRRMGMIAMRNVTHFLAGQFNKLDRVD